jgi:hypothetical protein
LKFPLIRNIKPPATPGESAERKRYTSWIDAKLSNKRTEHSSLHVHRFIAGRVRRKYAITHGTERRGQKYRQFRVLVRLPKFDAFRCASSKAKARRL